MDFAKNPEELTKAIKACLDRFVPIAVGLEPDRSGGYFSAWSASANGFIAEPTEAGTVRPEKHERYRRLSREKAARLASHPEHDLSSQSRDLKAERMGGAVRVSPDLIFGFSGFSEAMDEAFMIAAGTELGFIPESEILPLAQKSGLDAGLVIGYISRLGFQVA